MNDRTIVQHPNGYSGVLMGKSTMMIYDKDDNCILHTCFRTPNTEKELYEVLETMPRFIEILASVEADRKTEPQTDYKKWDAPPKVKLPTGEITTCVSVLAAAFEEASAFEDKPQHDAKEVAKDINRRVDMVKKEWNARHSENEPQTDCSWK